MPHVPCRTFHQKTAEQVVLLFFILHYLFLDTAKVLVLHTLQNAIQEVMFTADKGTQQSIISCRPCSVCAVACVIAKIKEMQSTGVYKHITKLIQCKQCTWKEQCDLISLFAIFRTNATPVPSLWLVLQQSYCCVPHNNFCGHIGKYSHYM